MKYNKKGEEILDMQLGAEKKRADKKLLFVVDTEARELLERILAELKKRNDKLDQIID